MTSRNVLGLKRIELLLGYPLYDNLRDVQKVPKRNQQTSEK
jgi:hypothetical protein